MKLQKHIEAEKEALDHLVEQQQAIRQDDPAFVAADSKVADAVAAVAVAETALGVAKSELLIVKNSHTDYNGYKARIYYRNQAIKRLTEEADKLEADIPAPEVAEEAVAPVPVKKIGEEPAASPAEEK